jgi:hypothetical protein
VSQTDLEWWALVTGIAIFATLVAALLVRRLLWPGDRVGSIETGTPGMEARAANSSDRRPAPAPPGRRPKAEPPPSAGVHALASSVRSLVLRAVAERTPVGWTALALCPPPHPARMIWHVHLAPEVALDLRDGRTVTVGPPLPSHEWSLPGGRTVAVGEGDPEPGPTAETVAVRVTGPYVVVTVEDASGESPLLVASVMGGGDELPQPRAAATDARAVQAALREAIELAIGSRMSGSPPALGYGPAGWAGHERIWLTIGS